MYQVSFSSLCTIASLVKMDIIDVCATTKKRAYSDQTKIPILSTSLKYTKARFLFYRPTAFPVNTKTVPPNVIGIIMLN